MQKLKQHPLIQSLLSLKGNAKVLTYLEPLWGIPYNLIAPFASLYMYAQGVGDAEIGLIVSISTVVKVIFSFLGGIIADKWGRKTATVVGDFLGWSLSCLIFAFSSNFLLFLIATLLNSFEQINQTSWQCLIVEDEEDKTVLHLYTWITISGLMAVFFAPISGLFISKYSLVPVVRVLYGVFAFTMLLKSLITLKYTTETRQGKIRKEQTRHVSWMRMMVEYKRVLPLLFRDRETLRVFVITLLLSITGMVTSTFFGLYANLYLGVAESALSLFPILRAVVMIVFIFGLARVLERFKVKKSLLAGLGLFTLSLLLLIFSPKGQVWPLYLYTLIEACAYSLAIPRKDSLLLTGIDKEERARILALVMGSCFIFTMPFGYITGLLSAVDRRLPFAFAALLYVMTFAVGLGIKEPEEKRTEPA